MTACCVEQRLLELLPSDSVMTFTLFSADKRKQRGRDFFGLFRTLYLISQKNLGIPVGTFCRSLANLHELCSVLEFCCDLYVLIIMSSDLLLTVLLSSMLALELRPLSVCHILMASQHKTNFQGHIYIYDYWRVVTEFIRSLPLTLSISRKHTLAHPPPPLLSLSLSLSLPPPPPPHPSGWFTTPLITLHHAFSCTGCTLLLCEHAVYIAPGHAVWMPCPPLHLGVHCVRATV